ncbi:MAG: RNA 2',3'-cyclic phosphodiesterase [Clostridia bacterium]
MRAFFAINFQQEFKEKIFCYAESFLRNNFREFRQVKRENIHITIHFLGSIKNDPKLLIERFKNLLIPYSTFKIDLNHFDYFNTRKGKLVWIGVKHNNNLTNIANLIREEFSDINKETREFLPHITIARDASMKYNIFDKDEINLSLPVKEISLMKSEFTHKGVIYREIFNKPLNRKDI